MSIELIKERFLSLNNVAQRVITGLVLIPIVLIITAIGGVVFKLMVAAAALVMLMEWWSITKAAPDKVSWNIFGIFYIILPCFLLVSLRDNAGASFVFWILLLVWATDIGAYVFGKTIGGWKLAPNISPNKTWAGFLGGIICAVLITIIIANKPLYPFFAAALSVTGQIGDLFESWVKRHFGVKDSGNIIPGHGGMLDRLDSLLFVSFAAGIYLYVVTYI